MSGKSGSISNQVAGWEYDSNQVSVIGAGEGGGLLLSRSPAHRVSEKLVDQDKVSDCQEVQILEESKQISNKEANKTLRRLHMVINAMEKTKERCAWLMLGWSEKATRRRRHVS